MTESTKTVAPKPTPSTTSKSVKDSGKVRVGAGAMRF